VILTNYAFVETICKTAMLANIIALLIGKTIYPNLKSGDRGETRNGERYKREVIHRDSMLLGR